MIRITQVLVISVFLFLTVMLSLNYSFLPLLPSYDERRILELLLVVLVVFWFLFGGDKSISIISNWKISIKVLLLLVITLGSISAYLSPVPRYALEEVSLFGGLFFTSCFTASLWVKYSESLVKYLVYSILLGVILYMIGFYTGYLAAYLENIPLKFPEPFFGFSNIRAFNQYQLWTLALLSLPILSFNIQRRSLRWGLYLSFVAWWVLFFYSGSRGVIVAWFAAMLVTGGIYWKLSRPLLVLQVQGSVSGLLIYGLLFQYLTTADPGKIASQSVLRTQTNDRAYLWQQAWEMLSNHPWFGIGPMHYAWYPNYVAAHPHNSLLQLAAEWGLPATILILLIFALGLYRWLSRFNAKSLLEETDFRRNLAVALFFTLIANSIYSWFDGVIVMPLSQLMLAVVVGLMLGIYSNQPQPNTIPAKIAPHRILAGMVLIALVWSVLPDVLPRINYRGDLIDMGVAPGPRFWQEGGIPH